MTPISVFIWLLMVQRSSLALCWLEIGR
jgi:hypothetical protein